MIRVEGAFAGFFRGEIGVSKRCETGVGQSAQYTRLVGDAADSPIIDTAPTMTITMAITIATIGRYTKKFPLPSAIFPIVEWFDFGTLRSRE